MERTSKSFCRGVFFPLQNLLVVNEANILKDRIM